jgi:hypothetical protein
MSDKPLSDQCLSVASKDGVGDPRSENLVMSFSTNSAGLSVQCIHHTLLEGTAFSIRTHQPPLRL